MDKKKDYTLYNAPYKFGKIVVTGANGRNGFNTLESLTHVKGVTELVALVRNKEKAEFVQNRLRELQEKKRRHPDIDPIITDNPELTKFAHVWINWKGTNLADLQKKNPNLEKEAKEKGYNLRDMLIHSNLKITIDDAKLALKYAPNCIYMQEGNPVDILARSVYKLGFKPGKVISTGAMMEYFRYTKLFTINFPEITLQREAGLYIGEHGETAVPVKEKLIAGITTIEEYVKLRHGDKGIKTLEKIYSEVNNEAKYLRDRLGSTPSEGPSAVSVDLVRLILHPQKRTNVGILTHVGNSYGLRKEEDFHTTVPASVGYDGAKVIPIDLREDTYKNFMKSVNHIKEMNKIADKIAKEQNLYKV